MQEFQERVGERMRALGLTYSEIERQTGISNSVLSRWFSDRPRRPTPANLEKLASVIGISYEDLLRMCDYLPGAVQSTDMDPELSAVVHAWPRLDTLRRGIIRDLIRPNARGNKLVQTCVAA